MVFFFVLDTKHSRIAVTSFCFPYFFFQIPGVSWTAWTTAAAPQRERYSDQTFLLPVRGSLAPCAQCHRAAPSHTQTGTQTLPYPYSPGMFPTSSFEWPYECWVESFLKFYSCKCCKSPFLPHPKSTKVFFWVQIWSSHRSTFSCSRNQFRMNENSQYNMMHIVNNDTC